MLISDILSWCLVELRCSNKEEKNISKSTMNLNKIEGTSRMASKCLPIVVILLMYTQAKETKASKISRYTTTQRVTTDVEPLKSMILSISNSEQKESSSRQNNYQDISYGEEDLPLSYEQLNNQLMNQVVQENDHLMTEKWLVDNINDLHRELKQTENDIEHYVQVTKSIIGQNEKQLKQPIASMYQPFQIPLPIPNGLNLNQLRDLSLPMLTYYSVP